LVQLLQEFDGKLSKEDIYAALRDGIDGLVTQSIPTPHGIIDGIKIDKTGRPVVLEVCEAGTSTEESLLRALDNRAWLVSHPTILAQSLEKAEQVSARDPAILLISRKRDVTERTRRIIGSLKPTVSLLTYEVFKTPNTSDLFLLIHREEKD